MENMGEEMNENDDKASPGGLTKGVRKDFKGLVSVDGRKRDAHLSAVSLLLSFASLTRVGRRGPPRSGSKLKNSV